MFVRRMIGRACSMSAGFQASRWLTPVIVLLPAIVMSHSSGAATFGLSGSASVNQVGAVTYSIPIDIPPGTAGMAPSLSLNYNSQGGDGFVGVGWSVGGLSQISRCPQTVAQDGQFHGVHDDNQDRFCLDGKRLMLISGAAYGANGAQYRTEIDSFSQIISHGTAPGGGPSYFEVDTRDGKTYYYGNTTDSQALDNGGAGPARVWALNKAIDTFGNFYTVNYANYSNALTGNSIYPVTINYTGNGSHPARNAVTFVYSTGLPANAVRNFHQGGEAVTGSLRLNSIYTDAVPPGGGTAVNVSRFIFGYQQSPVTDREELISVQRCNVGGGICEPATTFAWPDVSTNPGTFTAGSEQVTGFGSFVYGDFNGDGKTDMVNVGLGSIGNVDILLSNSDGTFTDTGHISAACPSPGAVAAGDFDGDGKTDLVCVQAHSYIVYIYHPATNSFGPLTAWRSATFCDAAADVSIGDFDGDGRTDLICNDATDNSHKVAFSQGDGSFAEQTTWATGGWCAPSRLQTGDFDGDRRTDLLCRGTGANANKYIVAMSNGDGSFTQASWVGPFCSTSSFTLGDFDGDGKTDLACNDSAGNHTVAFSNGDGSFDDTAGAWNNGSSWCASPSTVTLGDFNGDGRTDLACESSSGIVTVAVSNGTGGFDPKGGPSGWSCTDSLPGGSLGTGTITSGDFNGDGRSDLMCYFPTWSPFIVAMSNGAPDLISSFTSGTGAVSSFSYALEWAQGKAHDKGSHASYPTVSSLADIYVATSSAADNGIGGGYVLQYTYGTAQTDLSGHGFEGFAWVSSDDLTWNIPGTNIQNVTYYNQNWPLTGTISGQATRHYNPTHTTYQAIKEIDNSFVSSASVSGHTEPVFVRDIQTVQKSWSFTGTAGPVITATTSYEPISDGTNNLFYGNIAKTMVTSPSEGYTAIVCNTYHNDTTHWILGELSQTLSSGAVFGSTPACGQSTGLRTTTYTYDAVTGALNSQVIEPGNATMYVELDNALRDTFGNVTQIKRYASNAAFVATSYTFDADGRFMTSMTKAPASLAQTTSYNYDIKFGGLLSQTDPNLLTTSWTYDTFGRKATKVQPDGTTTSWTYSSATGCGSSSCYVNKTVTNAAGTVNVVPAATQVYDVLERPLWDLTPTFGGANSVVRNKTTYDTNGNVASKSLPYVAGTSSAGTTVYTYDDVSRVLTEQRADGGLVSHNYAIDATSTFNVVTTALCDTGGGAACLSGTGAFAPETTNTTTNSLRQVQTVVDANSTKTTYAYDPFNNPTSVTYGALINTVSMTYDLRGHRTQLVDPDSGTTNYTYDGLGKMLSQTDNTPNEIDFTYDLLDRPTGATAATGSTLSPTSSWTYDSATNGIGMLATSGTGTGTGFTTRSEFYDSFGRSNKTTTTVDGTNYNTIVTRANGRINTVTYPSGVKVDYNYTANGYLKSITDDTSGLAYWTANTEDASLNVTEETYGNGAVTTQSYFPTTGLVQEIQTVRSDATTVQDWVYSWDVAGNVTTRQAVGHGVETFSYDPGNRLTGDAFSGGYAGLPAKSYAYNAVGSITSKSEVGTYQYSGAGPHAVTKISGTVNSGAGTVTGPTYSYDAVGRLTIGGGRAYAYSGFGTPSCIATGTTTCVASGSTASTFTFDAEHNRVKQAAPEGTTIYIAAQGVRTEIFTGTAGTAWWRSYLMVGSQAVAMIQTAGTTTTVRYFHYDHLGSVTGITNDAGGSSSYAFDPWGMPRCTAVGTGCSADGADNVGDTITSSVNRGFTGQEQLQDSYLVHMNARVYDPQIGKFSSADLADGAPNGAGDWNRYAYVGGNPMNRSDPSGTYTIRICPDGPCNTTGFDDLTGGTTESENLNASFASIVNAAQGLANATQAYISSMSAMEQSYIQQQGSLLTDAPEGSVGIGGVSQSNLSINLPSFSDQVAALLAGNGVVSATPMAQSVYQNGGIALFSLGTWLAGVENGPVAGWTFGSNGTWYPSGWGGNGSVSILSDAADLAHGAGAVVAGVGVSLDTFGLFTGQISALHWTANGTVAAYSVVGGPFGALTGVVYGGIGLFYPGGQRGFATDYGSAARQLPGSTGIWPAPF